jgi:hypothetical protein
MTATELTTSGDIDALAAALDGAINVHAHI